MSLLFHRLRLILVDTHGVLCNENPSGEEGIRKLWNIGTMEYYTALKKKASLPFATVGVPLGSIMLSGRSQAHKHHMISLIQGME